MEKLANLENIKRSIKYFTDKAITCLILLKKELDREPVDVIMVRDYIAEVEGFVGETHKRILLLNQVLRTTK